MEKSKQKTIYLVIIVTLAFVVGWFFHPFWSQYINFQHQVYPSDIGLVATTTKTVKTQTSTTTPLEISEFKFGPLVNMYENKNTGLSMKYPNELINLGYGGQLMGIITTDSIIPVYGEYFGIFDGGTDRIIFAKNIYAKSLDDYRNNYDEPANQVETLWMNEPDSVKFKVTIYSNTDVTTNSGIKGIKQEYSFCIPIKNGCEESIHHIRYVFYTPKKEIKILITNPNRIITDKPYPFEKIERAIIDTVDYR